MHLVVLYERSFFFISFGSIGVLSAVEIKPIHKEDHNGHHFQLGTCRTVVLAVALQKIDAAPDAQAAAQSDHDRLHSVHCAVEKFHMRKGRRSHDVLSILNIQFFVFPHSISMTTETVI